MEQKDVRLQAAVILAGMMAREAIHEQNYDKAAALAVRLALKINQAADKSSS